MQYSISKMATSRHITGGLRNVWSWCTGVTQCLYSITVMSVVTCLQSLRERELMEEEKLDVEAQSRVVENGAVFDQKPRRYERSRDPRFARKVNFFHQFRALVSDPIALCDSLHPNCFVHSCM